MKKKIHLEVDEEVLRKLDRIAEIKGITVQELLSNMISDYLFGFVDDGSFWSPQPSSE